MPITLKEALQSLLVADLKDLIRYVPQAETVGRKDELIEHIADAMKGATLQSIWLKLDTLQAAAVAERYAVAVTPSLVALIDAGDPLDPIARQFVPAAAELLAASGPATPSIAPSPNSSLPGDLANLRSAE